MIICLLSTSGCTGNRTDSALIKSLRDLWTSVSVRAEKFIAFIFERRIGSSKEVIVKAEELREYLLREITRSRQKWKSELELVEKSNRAMSSIAAYLKEITKFLRNFAYEDNVSGQSPLIESGTRARENYEEITRLLGKGLSRINGDFFELGLIFLADRFRSSNAKLSAESAQILNTVENFMKADIKDNNHEVIWSLLSKKIREVYALFGVDKKEFASKWRSTWAGSKPVDYAISGWQIQILEGGKALVPVVIYLEKGSPLVHKVGLVFEDGSWKIERYPIAGLLGTGKSPYVEPWQD